MNTALSFRTTSLFLMASVAIAALTACSAQTGTSGNPTENSEESRESGMYYERIQLCVTNSTDAPFPLTFSKNNVDIDLSWSSGETRMLPPGGFECAYSANKNIDSWVYFTVGNRNMAVIGGGEFEYDPDYSFSSTNQTRIVLNDTPKEFSYDGYTGVARGKSTLRKFPLFDAYQLDIAFTHVP